MKHLVIQHLAY